MGIVPGFADGGARVASFVVDVVFAGNDIESGAVKQHFLELNSVNLKRDKQVFVSHTGNERLPDAIKVGGWKKLYWESCVELEIHVVNRAKERETRCLLTGWLLCIEAAMCATFGSQATIYWLRITIALWSAHAL